MVRVSQGLLVPCKAPCPTARSPWWFAIRIGVLASPTLKGFAKEPERHSAEHEAKAKGKKFWAMTTREKPTQSVIRQPL